MFRVGELSLRAGFRVPSIFFIARLADFSLFFTPEMSSAIANFSGGVLRHDLTDFPAYLLCGVLECR